MKKIGLAIALGKDANSLTKTFVEAVNYSLIHFSEFRQCEIKIVNDRKCSDGGIFAARELISWGANAVVGHFSSLAALSAIPIYRDANIPLVLPASTACELDAHYKDGKYVFFRYQRNNASLIAYCIEQAINGKGVGTINVIVQNSMYGNALLAQMPTLSEVNIIREPPESIEKDDTFVVIGYIDFAEEIIGIITRFQFKRLIVLDDAFSTEILKHIVINPLNIDGIKSLSSLAMHGKNSPFWNETILSLALGTALIKGNKIESKKDVSIETYLGNQCFTSDGYYEGAHLTIDHMESRKRSADDLVTSA